ncbi:MAG: LysM peptidoglycan-binding domain-containing protein [Bacteroidia bacterium]|nr:LysM peptidoglycan-binding domain-containing protein [Bacteroidia bacterium]
MKSWLSFWAFVLILIIRTAAQLPAPVSKVIEPDSAASQPLTETKGSQFLNLEDDRIDETLDGFVKNYHYGLPHNSLYDTLLLNTYNFRKDEVPTYPPAAIRQRLYELPTLMVMDYNEQVQRYIDLYTVRRRDQVSRMMGLSKVYFPIFERHLDRMGMPMEIKYLSVVESALNPHAVSRVGATGLWQFMLGTAKMYDLKVDNFVDERRDPEKSTAAAMEYLKNSYNEFGDWLLAIASYNCGPGNVRKAILRSGGKRNFWEIQPYLPKETQGYVPAFIAATYTFEYASAHNIYPTYVDFTLEQDTLQLILVDITLQEIAQMTGADYFLLKNLNPELKTDRIPYSAQPYVLRVPTNVAEYFAENHTRINMLYGRRRDQYIPSNTLLASTSGAPAPVRSVSTPAKPAGKLIYHTVRSGEVVGEIADKYNVTPRQIAEWNRLSRYRIQVGQKLKIYTNTPVRTTTTAKSTAGSPVNHTVRAGETLWSIAGKYPGTDVNTILRLNQGVTAQNLKPGQVLRVK